MFFRRPTALRRFLPLLLATLLVVLQMGAVLHALSHLADAGRPDSPTLPQHAVCAVCVAYAGTDGALATATPSLSFDVARASAPVSTRPFAALPPLALPYQVRAPPALAGV